MKAFLLLLTLTNAFFLSMIGQSDPVIKSGKFEEITLQTDRDIYLPGEKIWFRADYHLKGADQEKVFSKSIYIELVTPLGQSVASYKYAIINNMATGNYQIPEGLITATYMLRAYTQYQRNDLLKLPVSKLITVINPSVSLVGYENKLNWKLKTYPEGQGIINDVVLKVAIRIHPKIINKLTKLTVIDQYQDNIMPIHFYPNGLGIAEFYVEDTLNYSVQALLKNGDTVIEEIPRDKSGLAFEYEFLKSSVRAKITPSNAHRSDLNYKLSIYNGNLVLCCEYEILANDQWKEFELNNDILESDIKYLLLKNADGKIIKLRSVFRLPDKPKNINVAISNSTYKTRERVDVTIKPNNGEVKSYTVAVVKKGSYETEDFLIPGFIIENPQLLPAYLDCRMINDSSFIHQLEALFLVYEDMLKSDQSLLRKPDLSTVDKYWIPETRGITMRGEVKNRATGDPEKQCDVYVATIGDDPQLHVYTTNNKGEFIFTLKHVSGMHNLFLCVDSKRENELEILINSDFVNSYPSFYSTPTILDTSMRQFIEDMYVSAQVKEYYSEPDTSSVYKSKQKLIRFPEPFESILVDDYIALPTLREVINEIVPYVRVQKKKDNFSLEVLDKKTNQTSGNPLILIDNLPVFNVNELLKISPELINRISVINSTYVYGEHIFRGVVFFETNTNNFAGIVLPESSTFLEFQTIEDNATFTSPDHSSHTDENNRVPDFRNLLFWDPDVAIPNEGKVISFTTSDNEGTYEVIVRGVTQDGTNSIGTAGFNVIKK